VNSARVERGKLSDMVSQYGTLAYRARLDGSPYVLINQARELRSPILAGRELAVKPSRAALEITRNYFCPLASNYSARSGHTQARALAWPAAQLARQAPGGNYLAWPNQIAVNVDELNLRRRHTSLLQRRHDLVLGKALELFS
jgi:hypothetical protein